MKVIQQLIGHFWERGALTPEEAHYLVEHGFIRAEELEGYGPWAQAWAEATRAVGLLRDTLGERLIVHCTLSGRARLLDLWAWAKEHRLRHLDATREDEADGDCVSLSSIGRDGSGRSAS